MYEESYIEKKGLSESHLNEAQRTLHFIAENMKLQKKISEEGYSHFQQAIKALEQEPCEDCISRKDLLKKCVYTPLAPVIKGDSVHYEDIVFARDIINAEPIPQEPKTGHCKDCKWWKDSDGTYRRSSHAESKCPINRREVFEGNGYCYMFEAKMESEVKL